MNGEGLREALHVAEPAGSQARERGGDSRTRPSTP